MKPHFLRSVLLFIASTAIAATSGAEEPAPPAGAPAMHAERNSVPMMLTGIGLMTLGVVASGVGTGAMIEGRRECQSDRDPSRCVGESAPVNGGIAAIIGGSTLTVIGLGLTIAGAFKVVVPDRATTAPTLRVGLGSLSLSGTF